MKHRSAGRPSEGLWLDAGLAKLKDRIARWTEGGELHDTAVPGLSLFRREETTAPASGLYEPSLCMVAQGSKRVRLGDDTLVYDAGHYLITSVHLPTVVQILEASRETPYLGLKLTLDPREISQLMADIHLPPPMARHADRAMATGKVTEALLDAVLRLVDLLDEPRDIPILAPVIHREITYRLLVGEEGGRLRQLATAGSQGQQVARAIDYLKGNFTKPLRVEDLASRARMSPSTFHHHFRSVTALSPLQYQKRLRLHEARRLMLTERMDAASAAFQVGYESPSQFSREYGRLFGAPPLRDVRNLRRSAPGDGGQEVLEA